MVFLIRDIVFQTTTYQKVSGILEW
jgi:hypothetical protein